MLISTLTTREIAQKRQPVGHEQKQGASCKAWARSSPAPPSPFLAATDRNTCYSPTGISTAASVGRETVARQSQTWEKGTSLSPRQRPHQQFHSQMQSVHARAQLHRSGLAWMLLARAIRHARAYPGLHSVNKVVNAQCNTVECEEGKGSPGPVLQHRGRKLFTACSSWPAMKWP